ncbi:hypothetical protein KVR01_009434 [Diaporthe batatas]|uniref:uncharacterized protein n=1 Tax=Diaporthe batatas TaxID=748121 RepID=UPI001D05A39E|nr:uncharacterized protein KVR01_009434 [Diaporthe batatas]KAG8161170.1 hypothetical protein KVR01_009434 [Diaporthe batatas]
MSQQQNSRNTNDASPSRDSETAQSDLRLRTGLHIRTEPHESASERFPASEGEFGDGSSETAGSIPSTLRYRPRPSPVNESPNSAGSIPSTLRYRPRPSPVNESPTSGGGNLQPASPQDSVPTSSGGSLPSFLRHTYISPEDLPPPDTMRAVAQAFGFAVGTSTPSSPSPAAAEERRRDYWRTRSLSCPQPLDCELWSSQMYADHNPNRNWDEYCDFAEYCQFVQVLRESRSHRLETSHAPREPRSQPGSYSPAQGFGPFRVGIFHSPGRCSTSSTNSPPPPNSPVPPPDQQPEQPEQPEPRRFMQMLLSRILALEDPEDSE